VVTEADEAAVEAVWPVVDRQRVGVPVELERAARDAVAVPADDLPEVGAAGVRRRRAGHRHVVVERLEAEQHIGQVAVPVGHGNRLGDGPVGEDLHGHVLAVLQRVPEHVQFPARVQVERPAGELLAHRRLTATGFSLGCAGREPHPEGSHEGHSHNASHRGSGERSLR
jgi:hypothetical protein